MTTINSDLERVKIERLIKALTKARGNGTSMISLIIPSGDQISRASNMLTEEYGTASNIKNRVNRLSVLDAITSTQQRLKLYNKTPPNGLIIYCGTVVTDEGKEKRVTIDFEPFAKINTSLYLCDNKFHTEPLLELLQTDERFGFIIIDGDGALYGVVTGKSKETLHKFTVDLPKKQRKGGQSAQRFGRIRMEKRLHFLKKAGEVATNMFITNDKPNVNGLILAGLAEFKNDLATSDILDPRLKNILLKILDVSYGGENGFNQAIDLADDVLANVQLTKQRKVIHKFFTEIQAHTDESKFSIGVKDSMMALEMGAVDTLIVWDNLELNRCVVEVDDKIDILYLKPDQESGKHVIESMNLLEWLIENHAKFGAKMEIISDATSEGTQFVKGFGGIGALLRYTVNFDTYDDVEDDGEEFDDYI